MLNAAMILTYQSFVILHKVNKLRLHMELDTILEPKNHLGPR